MASTTTHIQELLSNPTETFALELKGWFDPHTVEGKAKLVRACIAMRNNNGGYLVVGIDDKTLQVQRTGGPVDVHDTFHPDIVQGVVAKYSSKPFEVHVHFVDIGGVVLPAIEVERGVRSPVAAKADLADSNGKRLVIRDRVYVRTLTSNNRVSTSEATHSDWERIVDVCFGNREADVGAFLRRHLLGLSPSMLTDLGAALASAGKPPPSIEELAVEVLDRGALRFEAVRKTRPALPAHGSWEIAMRVSPELQPRLPTTNLLNTVLSTNPDYTGWPVWTDTRGFPDKESRPQVFGGGWEVFTVAGPHFLSGHIDFWRIAPQGEIYLRRGFNEDLASDERASSALTVFDNTLPVIRVAEAIAVALEFARAMGAQQGHSLAVACRWSGLAGRELASWVNRAHWGGVFPGKQALQDSVLTTTVLPSDFAVASVAESVEKLVAPLLAVFDGYELPRASYESLVQRLLSRRL